MSDSFTETTHQSWLTRLKNSLGGVLVGLLLFLGSFVLLFWNEGNFVETQKSLEEGANAVISIDANNFTAENNDKLVHMSGVADTSEILADPIFNVQEPVLKLKRKVEMYQWEEEQDEETDEHIGGSSDTQTTYSYHQTWSEELIDSNQFKRSSDHQNPTSMPYSGETRTAGEIKLGAFVLSDSLKSKMNNFTDLPTTENNLANLTEEIKTKAVLNNNQIYLGNPQSPQIGDIRISFEIIQPQKYSLVSQQKENSFVPYQTNSGQAIQLLEPGEVSAAQMFANAKNANAILTWILRLVGFILMFSGLAMILRPLSVLADVVPFIGSLVGFGIGLIAGVSALALSLITIAIAWLYYRPIVGISLIVAAIAIVWAVKYFKRKN